MLDLVRYLATHMPDIPLASGFGDTNFGFRLQFFPILAIAVETPTAAAIVGFVSGSRSGEEAGLAEPFRER
jgi:hypothetical protein